mgnify:CR=1 FL=1
MKKFTFLMILIGLLVILPACRQAEPAQLTDPDRSVTVYTTPT